MRSINGESDQYFGGSLSGTRTQLQAVTGVSCPTSSSCIQGAGHGWHILSGANVTDGKADHCYFLSGASSNCSSYSGLDANRLHEALGAGPDARGPAHADAAGAPAPRLRPRS